MNSKPVYYLLFLVLIATFMAVVVGVDDGSAPEPYALVLQIETQDGNKGMYTATRRVFRTKTECSARAKAINKLQPTIWRQHKRFPFTVKYARCDLISEPMTRAEISRLNELLNSYYIGGHNVP